MDTLARDHESSVKGAIDAKADVIISRAGLPVGPPSIERTKDTALINIIAALRALEIICKKREKQLIALTPQYWRAASRRPSWTQNRLHRPRIQQA